MNKESPSLGTSLKQTRVVLDLSQKHRYSQQECTPTRQRQNPYESRTNYFYEKGMKAKLDKINQGFKSPIKRQINPNQNYSQLGQSTSFGKPKSIPIIQRNQIGRMQNNKYNGHTTHQSFWTSPLNIQKNDQTRNTTQFDTPNQYKEEAESYLASHHDKPYLTSSHDRLQPNHKAQRKEPLSPLIALQT